MASSPTSSWISPRASAARASSSSTRSSAARCRGNYIPAVGEAAEEAARKGAFGYPVVDISVTLVDGGFHAVDSSDMAFRTATRMAMQEALPKADPVLLEPMHHVTVTVPNNFTATAQRLLTGRRGQILGYAERPGWSGWDDVEALVPEVELHDFIIELRSQTMGLGTYRHRFDHLAEAHGKVVEEARKMVEAERSLAFFSPSPCGRGRRRRSVILGALADPIADRRAVARRQLLLVVRHAQRGGRAPVQQAHQVAAFRIARDHHRPVPGAGHDPRVLVRSSPLAW